MDSPYGDGGSLRRVSPFGHPRITGCMRLPAAFRCFLRPSSAPGAKAFSLCLLSLVRFASFSLLRFFFLSAGYKLVLRQISARDVKQKYRLNATVPSLYSVVKVQLEMKPFWVCSFRRRPLPTPMETKRLELLTPCLQGRCSPS